MALVPFPGQAPKPEPPAHDLDPDPDFRTTANRILRREPDPDPDPADDDGRSKRVEAYVEVHTNPAGQQESNQVAQQKRVHKE